MVKLLKFNRETSGRWFVDLPEWTGDKDDLEMVMGADTMLDYVSEGENDVVLFISTEPIKNHKFHTEPKYELLFKEEIYDGALYNLTGMNIELEVWLCHVTKFIFDEFPKKLFVY